MESNKSEIGKIGENIAANYLIQKGYEIVERNYRYSHGEIDLIVRESDSDEIVFVEVKTRNSLDLGDPSYAITKKKISQLKRIAELYLYQKEIKEVDCRFDVITVLLVDTQNPVIEHFVNAFF